MNRLEVTFSRPGKAGLSENTFSKRCAFNITVLARPLKRERRDHNVKRTDTGSRAFSAPGGSQRQRRCRLGAKKKADGEQ